MKSKSKRISALAAKVGKKLKNLRKKLGLTQQELSVRVGKVARKIDYTYIGKIERGEIMPSIKMLHRICEGLEVPVDFFFQEETITELLNILPEDIRDIARDNNKISFFKAVKELDEEDIPLVAEIIRVLNRHREFTKAGEGLYFPSMEHPVGSMISEKKATRKYRKKSRKKSKK